MTDKFLLPDTDKKRRQAKKKSKFPQPKYFTPLHPHKYVGSADGIVARSNLERRFFRIFDTNKNVIKWASEEMKVEYKSNIDGQIHRYFPDCIVQLKTRSGSIKTYMIEIKPKSQCSQPKKRNSKKFLNEMITYQTNQDKWNAAREFCQKRGMEFIILTEEHLGGF